MKDVVTERTLNNLYRKLLYAKNKAERDSLKEQIKIIKDTRRGA